MFVILYALVIGAVSGMGGTVYRLILAYEKILSWWFKFGAKYENKWFFPPVWGCQLCISGQIAGWSFIILKILPVLLTESGRFSSFAGPAMASIQNAFCLLFSLITCICMSILTAKILTRFINN